MIYQLLIKRLFFLFDPEKIHYFTFWMLKWGMKIPLVSFFIKKKYTLEYPKLERKVFGLTFKNPVGLAAGFDKDAKLYQELSNFGFGFIEIGTLTPKPQLGNPKKRLFRLKADEAIINRMGFNNLGVDAAVERLKNNKNVLVGGNIGKNKDTPNENATEDYLLCFEALYPYVDYFVVNVSSPNTPNLRSLQEKEPLKKLLQILKETAQNKEKYKPVLLKIAPDLTEEQLLDIVEIIDIVKIDGVIATNTTLSREGLKSIEKKEVGGMSGRPLKDRSTEVIRFLSEKSHGSFPIIGVGGINSPKDAIEKIEAGASLVQIYTGFIYQGPSLVKKINKALLKVIK